MQSDRERPRRAYAQGVEAALPFAAGAVVPKDRVERFFMILTIIGLTGLAATIAWIMLT